MTHDADTLALVSACIAKHATDVVELNRIFEILLCHHFHTQRVARHDYSFSNFAELRPDVGSRSLTHKHRYLKFVI